MSEPVFSVAKASTQLLLKCILSDRETSSEAFAEWENAVVFEEIDFQSLMLLPLLYLTTLKNDLECVTTFLRIKSIYRRTWTENQLLLSNLEAIFGIFNKSDLPFIVAEEAIRLLEIYNDRGVFSLQDFSIIAPASRKRDHCKALSDNFWHLQDDANETTRFGKEKLFSINIIWKTDKEFSYFLANSGRFRFGNNWQPILCCEDQILNLCVNEFLTFQDQRIKWKIISAILFNRQRVSISKLLEYAETRGLSDPLIAMLQILSNELNIEVADLPPDFVVKGERSKKIAGLVRRIRLLRRTYKMHTEFENQKATFAGFLQFLEKRHSTDFRNVLFKRALGAGLKILRKKS